MSGEVCVGGGKGGILREVKPTEKKPDNDCVQSGIRRLPKLCSFVQMYIF